MHPAVPKLIPGRARSIHTFEPEACTPEPANWATVARRCNHVSLSLAKRWRSPAREWSVDAARFIEVKQDDLLPRAEPQPAPGNRNRERRFH